MGSVSIEFGITFEHDGDYYKPLIKLTDIDPTGNVDEQVTIALEAANIGFARINEQLDISLSQIVAMNGKRGALDTIHKLETDLANTTAKLNDVIASIKAAGIKNVNKGE